MSTPSVLSALRAGRAAVAAGSPAYYRALPDTDFDAYETAGRLLARALYEATGGGIPPPVSRFLLPQRPSGAAASFPEENTMALTRFAIVAAVFIGAAWSPTATAATWIAAVGFGAYVVTVAIEDRRAK